MKLWTRIKRILSGDIDKYFRESTVQYVPVVQGGMWVDHDTALSLSAVFAAVRYIAETVASLPWELRQRKQGGGSDLAIGNNVHRLIHTRPNPHIGSFDWRVLMVSWANLWGNAYAEIERDTMNRPTALWPIAPHRVTPKRDSGIGTYYEVRQTGEPIIFPADKIFHIRGLGTDDLKGQSVVALAARSIGAGLAADQFQSSFYENGTVLSGVLEHPESLSDDAYDRLKKAWDEKHKGPNKAWRPAILEEGMKWQTINMPLKDAQFIESRKFTVNEIARWFRVPPHKIGDLDRATFSNIEHQSIEVVQDTIIPWAIRLEQEADYKLIGARAKNLFFNKINVNGLMRGDSQTRAEFYQKLRNMGAINTNEIRALEDMNPIGKDGDKYVMQGQYTTLEKIGEEPEIPPQLKPSFEEPEKEEEEENEEIKQAWKPVFYDALKRCYLRQKRRLDDNKKAIQEPNKFDAWMTDFIKEHGQYQIMIMRPVITGFAQAVGMKNFSDLEQYIQNIPETEKDALHWDYDDFELENAALYMMDEILRFKNKKYAVTA